MNLVVLILAGIGFVVVSNGLIHRMLERRHAAVREDLRDARVLLELEDVKASVSARGLLSASRTWFGGKLLVTDRAVVLFSVARGVVAMNQPPFVIVKTEAERQRSKQRGVNVVVAEGEPARETSILGTPQVAMKATGVLRSRWTLRVQTDDLDVLEGALRRFLEGEEPGSVYRKAAGNAPADEPAEPPEAPPATAPPPSFTDDFLDRDPETPSFRQSPFTEPIGHRAGIVCFESDATNESLWRNAAADLEALGGLPLGQCFHGAGTYDVEPFVAAAAGGGPLTAAAVLEGLRVRNFRSEHVTDLDRTEVPAPGYRGYSLNDEVHTDADGQHLFARVGVDEEIDEELEHDPELRRVAMEGVAAHEELRGMVDGPLWYVLLHEDGGSACPLVALFAVGRSRHGAHLVGVASQQVCHNLCD